jgi:hypothetical protein
MFHGSLCARARVPPRCELTLELRALRDAGLFRAFSVLRAGEDQQMDESKTGVAKNQEHAAAAPRAAEGRRTSPRSRAATRQPADVGASRLFARVFARAPEGALGRGFRAQRELLVCACVASALLAGSARAQEAGAPAPEATPPLADAPPAAPPPLPPPVVVAPPPPPAAVVVVAPVPPPALAPPPAAPAWSPVYTGSFFTRYELRQGFDNAGVQRSPRFIDGDAFFFRTRFGIGTGPIDLGNDIKVSLQFTPQASGVLGSLANTTTDFNLGLHEGYMRVGGNYVRLDTGRFELNYGDALVIGNLDWNETARSFDGLRSRISKSPTSAWLDLFGTVVREGRQLPVPLAKAADGDQYFVGAYAALGPAITAGLDLDVYLLAQIWAETEQSLVIANTMPPATYRREGAGQVTFGARVKQKIKMLDYRLEAGVQGGTRTFDPTAPAMGATPPTVSPAVDVLAYHADLELGVALVPDKFRVSVEGVYASGDDPSTTDKNEGWDELFPTAHKWLGLTDAFVLRGIKRTNVGSGVLHVTAVPVKNLTIQADGHLFARLEKLSTAPGAQTGMAGGEVDIGVVYQLAKGLKARGMYGVFLPDGTFYPTAAALAGNAGSDPVHFLELELRYDL